MNVDNEVTPFEHEAFGALRVITDGETGEPWFVAKDVAEALGYAKPENAVATHCKKKRTTLKQGGGSLSIISESDVYRLIIRSKLPDAERFEAWVMEEVLPSIRKHGMYATPQTVDAMLSDPETAIKMLTAFQREQVARKEVEAKLAEAQPKAQLVDATFAARNEQPMRLSEIVRKMRGVNTQAIKRDLYEMGYLYKAAGQYRVYSQYRGSHFEERTNPHSLKPDIYATAKGATMIAGLYYDNKLSMRKGYQ